MIEPAIATPNAAPIERKKFVAAVAVPMCSYVDGVLHRQHDHLHHKPDADTDQRHVDRRSTTKLVSVSAGRA